jgi:flagellar hook-associated protein 3 FlgL
MNFRISTAGLNDAAVNQMLGRQRDLSITQAQIASGKRVMTPADDPVAATRIGTMERQRGQLAQFARNGEAATSRLSSAELALSDAGDLLRRVRELAIQAKSGAIDAGARQSIVAELRQRGQALLDLANRRDAGGEYLFAGLSTQTQPFARLPGGVGYAGDQGARALQISPDQRVVDGFAGNRVFVDVPEGNGTFAVDVGTHLGDSRIDTGQVNDLAAWVPDSYTLAFTAADAWQVTDSAGAVVASGAYQSGQTISFRGVQVTVTGTPAVGDSYGVGASGARSVFDTVDDLVAALEAGAATGVQRSVMDSRIDAALVQIDQGLDNFVNLRAEAGARLQTIESTLATQQLLDDELVGSLSQLRDLDYAEAVGRMNQQMVGLQAAQAAYSRIAQMSLFDHL